MIHKYDDTERSLVNEFRAYPANSRERRILDTLEPEGRVVYCNARNTGAWIAQAVNAVTKTPGEALTLYGNEAPGDLSY